MILKVVSPQSIYDRHKRELYKSKDGFDKNKTTSFACVLEKAIKPLNDGKQSICQKLLVNIKPPYSKQSEAA